MYDSSHEKSEKVTDYSTAKQCFPFKLIAFVIASVLRLKCIRHKWFEHLFQFNSYYRTFDRVNCIRIKICTRKQLQTLYVYFSVVACFSASRNIIQIHLIRLFRFWTPWTIFSEKTMSWEIQKRQLYSAWGLNCEI